MFLQDAPLSSQAQVKGSEKASRWNSRARLRRRGQLPFRCAGADATAARSRRLGRQAMTVKANVGISADVEAMFSAVVDEFPKLDILVNNAGVQTWKALLDLEEVEWDRVIDTNLKGTFLCTQRAARQMKDSGGGSIINIGSGCNKVAFPHLVDYTASKGGWRCSRKSRR